MVKPHQPTTQIQQLVSSQISPKTAPIVAEQQMCLKVNSRLHTTLALYAYLAQIPTKWTFYPFSNAIATTRKITGIVLASPNLQYNQMFLLISNAYVDQYVQIRIQSLHVAVILKLIEVILFKLVVSIHFKVNIPQIVSGILYRHLTKTFLQFYFGRLCWVGINKGK